MPWFLIRFWPNCWGIKIDNPIFEDRPLVANGLKIVIVSVLAFTFVVGLALTTVDWIGAIVLFAVTLFDALLFYCVMPCGYQIYNDRLRIKLGWPLGMTLYFKGILSVVRTEEGLYASHGLRFATSGQYVLEIKRRNKISVTISPAGRDLFLEQIKQALREYQDRR
jgi:hypothetical protein